MPIKDLNLWGAPNVPMGHLNSPRGPTCRPMGDTPYLHI